jgi:hypothetical protein
MKTKQTICKHAYRPTRSNCGRQGISYTISSSWDMLSQEAKRPGTDLLFCIDVDI